MTSATITRLSYIAGVLQLNASYTSHPVEKTKTADFATVI